MSRAASRRKISGERGGFQITEQALAGFDEALHQIFQKFLPAFLIQGSEGSEGGRIDNRQPFNFIRKQFAA
jgi:hypothetical protein